jgi:hypothetical protein
MKARYTKMSLAVAALISCLMPGAALRSRPPARCGLSVSPAGNSVVSRGERCMDVRPIVGLVR